MKNKSHAGIVLVPPFAVKKHRELLAALDGQHAAVYVGMAALMGPNGYSLATCEEAAELDPALYGPMMMQGYNFLSGAALGKLLTLMVAELREKSHPIHAQAAEVAAEDTEGDEPMNEKIHAALMFLSRNAAEKVIRKFLEVTLRTAGMELQGKTGKGDLIVAGVSQMLGDWIKVASSTIKFEAKPRD